jgi:NAD(P)-dependent dehydrogenase (short-subunit alcohol dehydrogenase family)
MEINGKTALITGGVSGIGKTTARMLAARGARLMLVDVNQQLGDETVKSIEAEGGRAAFVRADVRDEVQMKGAFDKAVSLFGRLDIVFNNAGIFEPGFTRIPVEQWKRVLDVDLFGVALGCYLAFPLMREHGGVIVNTASMAGLYPIAGDPIYPAAKAGVIHLTHSLGIYWSKWGIRVNCVCPGVVNTPLAQVTASKERATAGRATPQPRNMMAPEAIAEAVIRFIEDDSQAGQVVEVRPTGVNVIEPRRAPERRS